jgi:imidazolonepropionase
MLRVIETLEKEHPCTIVPTFLGAHTIPPEYQSDPDGYVELVIGEMIPAVAQWYGTSVFQSQGTPLFIDVFCEDHAFNVEQSRRVLEAGQAAGMLAKIHTDQFHALGGTEMAVSIGAVSADHLDVTGQADIARLAGSSTICVPLPAVTVNFGQSAFAPARSMIDAGAALALATDFNPGSAPCPSLPLVMALSCRYQRLTPAEVLHAVTINAAWAVGLGQRVGSLEVGRQADLFILKAADYRHLAYFFGGSPVEAVIKGGEVVWPQPHRH